MQTVATRPRWRSLVLCLLPGAVGLVLIALARLNPARTEQIYAREIYPIVANCLRLLNWPPFSVAGVVVWGGGLLGVALVVWLVVLAVRRRWEMLFVWLRRLLLLASCVLLLFAVACAPNYHRLTFTELSGLDARPSTVVELEALCAELVATANLGRQAVSTQNGIMAPAPGGFAETAGHARAAFDRVSETFPFVGRSLVTPKPMLVSEVLSYLKVTGFYFAYTGEANINAHMPPFELGFTMCHELAHTRGFMREDEANFIAYLACRKASSPDVAYSGALCALNYATNALYSADPARYFALRERYSDGVTADLTALSAYWNHYETPVATVSNAVNDFYLRANNQTDGTRSYGRMVDLLLADYRQRHGLA